MPVRSRLLAPACLTLALAAAACGGAASTPSASTAASAAPSVAATASASPAASSDASASPAASASAGAEVTVTAVDFKFEGVPAQVPTGTPMRLVNQGQEVHEMVVVRKLPTTTQSFEELLAMPGDEAQSLVENVGVAFAEPGQTAADVVTAGEPGDYLMVCFIPAGTTSLPSMDPNASEAPSLGTGAPHFTLGMLQEFTVTQ
jgi:plastocyanin